jgi:hypothetical protein
MGKCAIIRFAACAAFVFAASETLQAAELTHRWSFNGDWADSAGGADAAKCGTYGADSTWPQEPAATRSSHSGVTGYAKGANGAPMAYPSCR